MLIYNQSKFEGVIDLKKKRTKRILFGTLIALLIGFAIYSHFENTSIETSKISITNSDIPSSFDGYKIVQISDLHNVEFGDNNEILLNKIQENNPDAIFITGDIVDRRITKIDIAVNFIEQAVKIAPIYYVPGNHEASVKEYQDLADKMESLGVNIPDKKFVELKKDGSKINLMGFSDSWFADGFRIDTDSIFSKYPADTNIDLNNYTILLSHRPELLDFYAENNIDLVFSGHAHGGQIRLPFIGGVVAPGQGLFPEYTSGVYEKASTKMIVSRGLGNSFFPFRINNNPELIVVTLKSK